MEQIGRYNILGEIGRGAMGIVYRAQDPAIGRIVAIKTIRLGELADTAERARLRDRLMREAQSAGILSHPGIVTIYDAAEQDDLAYIAMEYVDGPTLERMLASDPPDGNLILEILVQTAAALDYAHKRGIVHRDIKPANIMMHERTTAKITDFGVARIQSHQMTQVGSMVGTPNYMSPEQIQGLSVDGRSDQFSLAVIAYELLTGEKPFTADVIPALAFKIVQEQPAAIHRLNPTLGWQVDTVLQRALSKSPEDRYPTCSEFASAVENACRSCKGWKPGTPGALQSMPTIAAPVVIQPQPVVLHPRGDSHADEAFPRIPLAVAAADDDIAEETPAVLRWARKAALLTVAVGAVVLLGLLVLRAVEGPDTEPVAVRDETAGEPAPPSPLADQPDPAGGQPSSRGIEDATPSTDDTIDAPTREDRASVTRLVSDPPGATVVLDGKAEYTCQAPCSFELPPGRHTLAATLEGHRRALRIFETPKQDEIFVHLERTTGALMVRSEPPGASIVVDGRAWTEKTPAMLTLPTGRHTIELVHNGRRETHEVVIRESVITNVAMELP